MSSAIADNILKAININATKDGGLGFSETSTSSYQVTKLVKYFHESTPRFGHSENVALLASDISTEQKDYVVGTMFVSLFLVIILFLWCVGLATMKVMNHLGLTCSIIERNSNRQKNMTDDDDEITSMSGADHSKVSLFEEFENSEYSDGVEVKQEKRKLLFTRITFIVFAVFSVVSTVLLAGGLSRLEESYESLQNGNAELHSIMQSGFELTDEIMLKSERVILQRDKVVGFYTASLSDDGVFCPKSSDTMLSIAGNSMSKSLTNLGQNFINPSFLKLNIETQQAFDFTTEMQNELDSLSWWFWFSMNLIIVVNLMCIAFIVGLISEWQGIACGWYQKCQSDILIPIFIAIVLLIGFTSAGFAMVLVVNADFCYGPSEDGHGHGHGDGLPGSPDQVVLEMLDSQIGKDSLLYRSFENYIEVNIVISEFIILFIVTLFNTMLCIALYCIAFHYIHFCRVVESMIRLNLL